MYNSISSNAIVRNAYSVACVDWNSLVFGIYTYTYFRPTRLYRGDEKYFSRFLVFHNSAGRSNMIFTRIDIYCVLFSECHRAHGRCIVIIALMTRDVSLQRSLTNRRARRWLLIATESQQQQQCHLRSMLAGCHYNISHARTDTTRTSNQICKFFCLVEWKFGCWFFCFDFLVSVRFAQFFYVVCTEFNCVLYMLGLNNNNNSNCVVAKKKRTP